MHLSAFKNHLEVFQQLETHPLQLKGMENLLISLNNFKDNMSLMYVDEVVQLYKSATLPSADIIRADPSYNNSPWFSDVAIVMDVMDATNYTTDQGICFGKVSITGGNVLNYKYKLIISFYISYYYWEKYWLTIYMTLQTSLLQW